MRPKSSTPYKSNGPLNTSQNDITSSNELWRCHKSLRAHESDVTSVEWSSDNKWLATGGLDKIIYVWSGLSFGTSASSCLPKIELDLITIILTDRLRKLEQCQGFVKGLSFDPTCQYLAAQVIILHLRASSIPMLIHLVG